MLNHMLKNEIYGVEIGKEEVAFSSPTGDGARLARGWQKNAKVYDC